MSGEPRPHGFREECVCALDDYLKLAEEWRVADIAESQLRRDLDVAEQACSAARKRMFAAKSVLDSLITAEASRG